MNIKCKMCQKKFSTIYTFKKHVWTFHPDEADKLAPKKTYNFHCQDCGKNFSHMKSITYHRKKVHLDGKVKPLPSKKKCPICDFYHSKVQELSDHFINFHRITLQTSHHDFSSKTKFTVWKETVEKETKTRFVKYKGARILSNSQQSLDYVCHRSGTFTSKGKGLRLLKSQGSNKINGFCPAGMKVVVSENESCKVTFCETHVGHENDINHLFLNSLERQQLAAKLANNEPFSNILKEVHCMQQNLQSERMRLLKRKDLHNIKYVLQRKLAAAQIKKEKLNDTKGKDEDAESHLVINCDNAVWVEESFVEDHDYMCSRKIDSLFSVSLSEEKKRLKSSLSKIISSISSMEEVEAMKKNISSIKQTLAEAKLNGITVENTPSVQIPTTNIVHKKNDNQQRRFIITRGIKQIHLYNPQQFK